MKRQEAIAEASSPADVWPSKYDSAAAIKRFLLNRPNLMLEGRAAILNTARALATFREKMLTFLQSIS
jgi:hypothetical protein